MKFTLRTFKSFIQITVLFMLLTMIAQAQASIPKDYKGNYATVAIEEGLVTDDDTSDVFAVPSGIHTLVYYGYVDSLSASDSVRLLYQVSEKLSGGTWTTLDSTAWGTAEGAILRKTTTSSDYFVRWIRDLKGTTVSTLLKFYLSAKSY